METKVWVKQGSTTWVSEFDEFDISKIYKEITANPYNADRNRFWVETGGDGFGGVLMFDTKHARKIQEDSGYGETYSKRDLRNLLKWIKETKLSKHQGDEK